MSLELDEETLAQLGFADIAEPEWLASARVTRGDFDAIRRDYRKPYAEMSEATKERRRESSRRWYYANREKALAAQRRRDALKSSVAAGNGPNSAKRG